MAVFTEFICAADFNFTAEFISVGKSETWLSFLLQVTTVVCIVEAYK